MNSIQVDSVNSPVSTSVRDTKDSFLESPYNHFPQLPWDSYVPNPKERIDIDISYEDIPTLSGSTLTYLLQLAWALVLADHSNTNDVVFGVACGGRRNDTGQQVIMPCRLNVRSESTVEQMLADASRYDHQMRQFEHLGLQKFGTLSPENVIISRFRNLLVVGNQIVDDLPKADSFVTPDGQHYPLIVHCRCDKAFIRVSATFDPIVLSSDTLHMMLCQFSDVFKMSCANRHTEISSLQRVGPEGLKQLRQWNDGVSERSDLISVLELIEQRCKKFPSATAIHAWDGILTYGQLDERVSLVASRLSRAGIKPGKFVGLFMPKSVLTVVAMLGVARAGGAFLLLAPSLPTSRLQACCRIADVHLVLSVAENMVMASELGAPVMELHLCSQEDAAKEASGFQSTPVEPHHPLYAIFTSGSSGEPKGVVVNRASFGPGVRQYCSRTQLESTSRVFQFASYAFIVSIAEQFMALAAGACICVPSEKQLQNEVELAIDTFKATWIVLTPSMSRTLDPRKLPSLKTLLLAGEPVDSMDVERWRNHVSVCSYYGQSETASTYFLQPFSGSSSVTGSLGHTTTGACWIVDVQDYNKLKPIGTEGELLIESSALASGYINLPEQTAATFVERPAWLEELRPDGHQGRCILTGDIVRYHSLDGSIQIIGRKGTWTKIRGQRVELGEIEYYLRLEWPKLYQAVAEVIRPASPQGEQPPILVAFVYVASSTSKPVADGTELLASPSDGHRLQARKVISKLRDVLPSYMVPSAIIPLRFLPRTVTGKIYRKGLRQGVEKLTLSEILSYQGARTAYRAPVTETERIVQSICERVLGLPPSSVGLDDNFFRVGGDSLSARRLTSTAHSQGVFFTVADVFEMPTLASLARSKPRNPEAVIDGLGSSTDTVPKKDPFETLKSSFLHELPLSLAPENIEDVFPTRELQTFAIDSNMVDYFPFEIKGALDKTKLRHACQIFLEAYSVFRSVFVYFHGHMLQVVLRHIDLPFTEITAPAGQDVTTCMQFYCSEDKKNPPPIHQPIIKFALIHGEPQHCFFVVRLSHAQYDGACLRQIVDQLGNSYNNDGQPLRVISDFSSFVRQCDRLRTPRALRFWRDLMAGAEITRLPRCSPGENECVIYSGECHPADPPPGITMATAIKAAWSYVLWQATGKKDVLFGQVVNCRGGYSSESQGAIGMFLNVTPVRVKFTDLETIHDLFRALQQQHVRAMDFETIGWSDMVKNSTPWPKATTHLDSMVLHENFGSVNELELGSATGRISSPIFSNPVHKQHFLVTWPGPQSLTTFLLTRAGAFQSGYAESLVEKFNKTLLRFLDIPEASLHSA